VGPALVVEVSVVAPRNCPFSVENVAVVLVLTTVCEPSWFSVYFILTELTDTVFCAESYNAHTSLLIPKFP